MRYALRAIQIVGAARVKGQPIKNHPTPYKSKATPFDPANIPSRSTGPRFSPFHSENQNIRHILLASTMRYNPVGAATGRPKTQPTCNPSSIRTVNAALSEAYGGPYRLTTIPS